jgi:outer membrane protein assembly factor BamB
MRNYVIPFFVVIILFYAGCKDESTGPSGNQSGYQTEINWPSLANSPWPALHKDMQRTGRSPYTGPSQGIISTRVSANNMQAGAVFGTDAIFYYPVNQKLIAADLSGSILWETVMSVIEHFTSPLVSNNGTIYTASGQNIHAFNPDGTPKWTYHTNGVVLNRGLGIDKNGTIYAVTNEADIDHGVLYAVSEEGALLWKIENENFGYGIHVNIAFSPDGRTLYLPGASSSIVAFDLDTKTVKWSFGTTFMDNGPMVDAQGNVYILTGEGGSLTGTFYSLDQNGNIRWTFEHSSITGYYNMLDPTIDKDGNIYLATDTLYALDYSGNLRWKLGLNNRINFTPLVCDKMGTVYMNTVGPTLYDNLILAVSKDGVINWSIPVTDVRSTAESPAISSDGTLVFPTFRSDHLLVIK